MAMCLLHALGRPDMSNDKVLSLEESSKANEEIQNLRLENIQYYFGKWCNFSEPFDIGNTTFSALHIIDITKLNPVASFNQTEKVTKRSESNGCLMRITPIAVWAQKLSPEDLFEAVKYQTMFTHSNERAIMACYLYCFAI